MWEEDPRWQQANYRLLVWTVVIGLVGGFLLSLYSGDWQPYYVFLRLLGGFAAVLCAYAALVWTIGHLSIKLWRVLRKLSHK